MSNNDKCCEECANNNDEFWEELTGIPLMILYLIVGIFRPLMAIILMSIVYHFGAPLWFAIAFCMWFLFT
jgi:hypothetical protein